MEPDGIVRFEVGGIFGTGFVVRVAPSSADPGSATVDVLTAFHVLADYKRSLAAQAPIWHAPMAQIRFQKAEALEVRLDNPLHDIDADWALVRVTGKVPAAVKPMRLAGLEERTTPRAWSTYGYNDAQREGGGSHSGQIEGLNADGEIELFSKQAAAGQGGFVSGCSGAPCVFEGHVVGIILEALQDGKQRAVHGGVYALPIESVAKACGLTLAPVRSEFSADVEAALAGVSGDMLLNLATALDVPHTESEPGLRTWIGRALLAATPDTVRRALVACVGFVRDPTGIAEMALAHALLVEGVGAVRSCFQNKSSKGVATVAREQFTARLLVARALGAPWRERHFHFIDVRAPSPGEWAKRVSDGLRGLMGFSPEDIEDAVIDEELTEWGGAMIAFPLERDVSPLAAVERYTGARALAMLSPEAAAVFSRAGYELAPVVNGATAERDLFNEWNRASRYFRSPAPGSKR
jgi:hypothetical protein